MSAVPIDYQPLVVRGYFRENFHENQFTFDIIDNVIAYIQYIFTWTINTSFFNEIHLLNATEWTEIETFKIYSPTFEQDNIEFCVKVGGCDGTSGFPFAFILHKKNFPNDLSQIVFFYQIDITETETHYFDVKTINAIDYAQQHASFTNLFDYFTGEYIFYRSQMKDMQKLDIKCMVKILRVQVKKK
eukprot:114760_1